MAEPDLRDLQAFAVLARHRNFRRAAQELGISTSSLSQRLRELEQALGLRLLNRTTRSVAPTELGTALLDRLGPALDRVADAVRTVQGQRAQPAGRLRITAPAPAAHLVLAPMIAPFLLRYPDIALDLIVDASFVDIVAAGFDAGIRYEEHLAQDMIAVPLGPPQRYVLVASPDLLARSGVPRHPRELLEVPTISGRFPSGQEFPWEFERGTERVRVMPRGPLKVLDIRVQLRAALDGLGFLVTFDGYAKDAIASGSLVPVLDDWLPSFPGPLLYYPSRRQPPPPLAAFLDFLRDWRRMPQPREQP